MIKLQCYKSLFEYVEHVMIRYPRSQWHDNLPTLIITLHNEAKSPGRVHFWDLCNIYDFKPIFGVFHAWRPQNKTQSDVDLYLLSLP